MTIYSILAETKHLIPDPDEMKVMCNLKSGKKIAINVADHLDFDEEYTSMRGIVYGEYREQIHVNRTKEKRIRNGTIIRRDTDGKVYGSLSELCRELGMLASSSGTVLKNVKEYGFYKNIPYTILKIRNKNKPDQQNFIQR